MTKDNDVMQLINRGLSKSYSYLEYRDLMAQMLIQGMSTSEHQSETLTHYSMLNQVRMNRLDRVIIIPDKIKSLLTTIKNKYIFIVLTESWCGDAAQIMPVINKMALIAGIEYKIILRDENEELMNHFLTNGSKSIPKLLVINAKTNEVVTSWGPRPAEAVELVNNLKEKYGSFNEEAKTELQKWYLYDKGLTTMNEICKILRGIEAGHDSEASSDSETSFTII